MLTPMEAFHVSEFVYGASSNGSFVFFSSLLNQKLLYSQHLCLVIFAYLQVQSMLNHMNSNSIVNVTVLVRYIN